MTCGTLCSLAVSVNSHLVDAQLPDCGGKGGVAAAPTLVPLTDQLRFGLVEARQFAPGRPVVAVGQSVRRVPRHPAAATIRSCPG
jgi:hypothetical protein